MLFQIRKRLGDFVAIGVLIVIAAGIGGYILNHQRLRFPFIQKSQFNIKAEFSTAQAVTPGQGQTVRVAGIRVGDIAKVSLDRGRAVVTLALDPQYKKLVHTDATALLRPKTGLKDMFIEINPGSRSAPFAKENWTMPVNNTLPDINPDEIYQALDGDTRPYLKLLVNGAGRGLDNRGADLKEVFTRFEPTYRDIARVSSKVAERRANLRRLVNSLQRLNTELATRGDDLAELIQSSSVVFRAFASENQNIAKSIRLFPPALRQTTSTLTKVDRFAKVLAPTADRLRPVARSINRANLAVRPFAREAAPIIQNQIRPFVRDARPLVRNLQLPAARLADATPDLTRSFVVLNHLFDLLAYNEGGAQPPSLGVKRNESYLFWVAWVTHLTENVFNTADAHGSYRPVFLAATCNTFQSLVAGTPLASVFLNLTPILTNATLCP